MLKTPQQAVEMIRDKSEVINDHLWYVNPEVILDAVTYVLHAIRESDREEVSKLWCGMEFLDHHDEGNDRYWDDKKGNHHVMSMHISDFDKINKVLTAIHPRSNK